MMIRRLALAVAVCFASSAFAEVEVAALWKKECKGCHGETGKADTKKGKELKIKDMTTAEWQKKQTDEDIKKGITDGVPKTKMKSFKEKLSAEEMDALAKYVRTLKE